MGGKRTLAIDPAARGSQAQAMMNGGAITNSLRTRAGPLCLVSAACFLVGFLPAYGYVTVSALAALVPLGAVTWLVFGYMALRTRQGWWVVASVPAMALPLVVLGLILEACSRGDCL